jgi:hypothetical protein
MQCIFNTLQRARARTRTVIIHIQIQALGPTQCPIQWLPGAVSLGGEADHSSPPSAMVKNA